VSLKELVSQNYISHPAFGPLASESWKIEDSLIKDFNAIYRDSRQPLSTDQLNQALNQLSVIFASLHKQAASEHSRQFVLELQSLCVEFIEQEYIFRKKIKPNPDQRIRNGKTKALLEENYFFGNLSEQATTKIQSIVNPLIQEFRKRAADGKLKRSDLSQDSGLANWRVGALLDKEFRKQGVFKILAEAFGVRYTYTGMSIELSVAGSTWWKDSLGQSTPPATMYAHLDETVYAPKSIVYLSEVTRENGPTSCYPGLYREIQNSALQDIIGRVVGRVGATAGSPLNSYYAATYHQTVGSENFRRHFMSLPGELRFNSHFGWDVLPGSELESRMKSEELVMTGSAGKFIVFDGSQLLHRGGLIEAGERIALQVVFYSGSKWLNRLSSASKSLYSQSK
jgi:hypothetical protein